MGDLTVRSRVRAPVLILGILAVDPNFTLVTPQDVLQLSVLTRFLGLPKSDLGHFMMNYPIKSEFSLLGTSGALAIENMFKNNEKIVDW